MFTHLRRKPQLLSCGGMRSGCPPKPWRRRTRFGGFRRRHNRDHGCQAVGLHLLRHLSKAVFGSAKGYLSGSMFKLLQMMLRRLGITPIMSAFLFASYREFAERVAPVDSSVAVRLVGSLKICRILGESGLTQSTPGMRVFKFSA